MVTQLFVNTWNSFESEDRGEARRETLIGLSKFEEFRWIYAWRDIFEKLIIFSKILEFSHVSIEYT